MDFGECERLASLNMEVPDYCTQQQTVFVPVQTLTASSATEEYVRTRLSSLHEIDGVDVDPIMEQLNAAKAPYPVTPEALGDAMARLPKPILADYKRVPDFFPRALKTLNGEEWNLVPHAVLREAVGKERVMAGMKHGWGVSDPPLESIAVRTLVSSGLDPRVLPKYTRTPPNCRGRLMAAWAASCAKFHWFPYQPDGDVQSESRAQKTRANLSTNPHV